MSRKARIIYNGRKLTNLWRHDQRDQVWQKAHRGIGPKASALQQDSARNEKAPTGTNRRGVALGDQTRLICSRPSGADNT